MDFVGNKLLVAETDDALRQRITEILVGAGYEVFVNYDRGMKSVLECEPDVILMGADPPNFDCCQLLSEIKGSDKTSHIRVIMLAPGGPAERSFGLDLGADDVLTIPFDDHELLARVRAQLRDKRPEDVLRERVLKDVRKLARELARGAVTHGRRRLRAGIALLLATALILICGFAFFSWRSQADQRLGRLETESGIAQEIIRSYASSVCLLHVIMTFKDASSGLSLHYAAMTSDGAPLPDVNGEFKVRLGGSGPVVRMGGVGSGFLVSADGQILTNRHVVEPWLRNDQVAKLLNEFKGLEPVLSKMTAYFPGISKGIDVRPQKISQEADLAVVTGDTSDLKLRLLALDDSTNAAVSGEPVVLLGYPTGLAAILARAPEDTAHSIAAFAGSDSERFIAELARRNLIRPVSTQGHLGDVISDKIFYDAQTASGGSGGPLFNAEGKVIAVNVGMVRNFGGSNFAIPVRYTRPLLTR